MIDQVLTAIVGLLNNHIGTLAPEVVLGNLSMMDSSSEDGTNITDRVVLSVVNIQQESTLRNLPANRQILDNSGQPQGVAKHPPLLLNIFLLVGANKVQYNIGLQRISQVLSFFQKNPIFTEAEIPALPSMNLEKIIFDMHSGSFEELNQLWSIMGGKYIPSVLYKMRMAYIDSIEENMEIPLVKSIESTFTLKNK
ncbi:DUF4255 domain-containing protein [Algoriphagus sp. D3-2-R+10]|uniref:DUF4255 domain-containing protein n=1 Tax=Algoriphagus aurantiacus TaxID=3103948 RepID=UPI002B373E56|nr:DUF4255 domain-containing protein [Algoriphagus sp. D3-2-R+10]MEB2773746.1 DUF4255 domain-containing protein [Algoriphagus sp. D3-2-R+10]